MQSYANLGGDSGISGYEIGDGEIVVAFSKGGTYRYTDARAGAQHVAQMQFLAQEGQGLNTYINKYVRGNYTDKW